MAFRQFTMRARADLDAVTARCGERVAPKALEKRTARAPAMLRAARAKQSA